MNNSITIKLYSKSSNGIIPNPIFHRALDNLHSRCIEYPLVASKIPKGKLKLLDIGSAKSDEMWIKWLAANKGVTVDAVDYDDPLIQIPRKVSFVKTDVRKLPYEDNVFDVITAVSVIEHIGLENPQVSSKTIPKIESKGDTVAFREMLRVLKPNGKIIMTFPFGNDERLILNNEARCYNMKSLKKFDKFAQRIVTEYYEYQNCSHDSNANLHYSIQNVFIKKARSWFNTRFSRNITDYYPASGEVTWKKINTDNIQAKNIWHVDGILCGVWKKIEGFQKRPKIIRLLFPQYPHIINKTIGNYSAKFKTFSKVEDWRVESLDNEDKILNFLLSHISRGDIFIDVGGCLGIYAIFATLRGAKTLVFEPDPNVRQHLDTNVTINRLIRKIKISNKAISDTIGVTKFFIGAEGEKSSSMIDSTGGRRQINVKTVTIDSLFKKENNKIDIIKMDIEGGEYLALKGMRKTLSLARKPKMLIIEFHPNKLALFKSSFNKLDNEIISYGYILKIRRKRDKQINTIYVRSNKNNKL